MEILRTVRTVDGATIGYRLSRGSGTSRRLIVLLHGVASNMSRWSEFVEHTSLNNSFDLLRVDLRGHGESFTRSKLKMEFWCKDLRDILDAEGYDQTLLIGHSLGAQVAVQFAARFPTRALGLVLIDPVFKQALRGSLRAFQYLRPVAQMMVAVIRLLNMLGLRRRRIPNRDLRELDEKTRKVLLSAGRKKDMIELYSSPWEDFKFFPVASFIQELLEITRPLPPLAQIKLPFLVLFSSGITYTDPIMMHQMLAEHPRLETVTIDAHHWPLTENPLLVRTTIEEWCGRLP